MHELSILLFLALNTLDVNQAGCDVSLLPEQLLCKPRLAAMCLLSCRFDALNTINYSSRCQGLNYMLALNCTRSASKLKKIPAARSSPQVENALTITLTTQGPSRIRLVHKVTLILNLCNLCVACVFN